ncbi:MAG: ATP-dependent sacrificial sulfur transferase LarE [Bacillota bacterium]
MQIYNKYEELKKILRDMERVVVAFSGGVDSTFLVKAAYDVLGEKVTAATITSPFHAAWEIEEAKKIAEDIGIKHTIITKGLENEELRMNPQDRCYICKKEVFGEIKRYAESIGCQFVADGSNYDDTFDYRPGMKALKELGIRSPLLEAGLLKEEIRTLSRELELPTWDKPAFACLLTRIPYGQEIKEEDLHKIEKTEAYLMQLGFRQFRVRFHGPIARIELEKKEMEKIFDLGLMSKINDYGKQIGFQYVTLDLEGYKTGRMNEGLKG